MQNSALLKMVLVKNQGEEEQQQQQQQLFGREHHLQCTKSLSCYFDTLESFSPPTRKFFATSSNGEMISFENVEQETKMTHSPHQEHTSSAATTNQNSPLPLEQKMYSDEDISLGSPIVAHLNKTKPREKVRKMPWFASVIAKANEKLSQ